MLRIKPPYIHPCGSYSAISLITFSHISRKNKFFSSKFWFDTGLLTKSNRTPLRILILICHPSWSDKVIVWKKKIKSFPPLLKTVNDNIVCFFYKKLFQHWLQKFFSCNKKTFHVKQKNLRLKKLISHKKKLYSLSINS